MQNTANNLVTVSEAARILRCSEATVRNLDRRGIMPASRLSNGARVFDRAAVNSIKESREQS
jgi:excisionase family DNA binding protein